MVDFVPQKHETIYVRADILISSVEHLVITVSRDGIMPVNKGVTMKIWKYPLRGQGATFQVLMPQGARPLHVGLQRGTVCVWALVDPTKPAAIRQIDCWGTNEERDDGGFYLGTVEVLQEMWHYFDRGETLVEGT